MTIYSWCDLWQNGGVEVTELELRHHRRKGKPKSALAACENFNTSPPGTPAHRFSVIVCTRNGGKSIAACLRGIAAMTGGPYETIVVDDGSTDGTSELVSENFPASPHF